jgi:hypothetical protein
MYSISKSKKIKNCFSVNYKIYPKSLKIKDLRKVPNITTFRKNILLSGYKAKHQSRGLGK